MTTTSIRLTAGGVTLVDWAGTTLTVGTYESPERVASTIGADRYTVDLCVGWVKVAECPTGVFTGITRDLELGEWRLEAAVDAVIPQTGFTLEDIDTVRLVRNNELVFAGHVRPVDVSGVGGLEVSSTDEGEFFALSGPDAWYAFANRIAYPDPATEPPWASSHDTRSGVASTVAAEYIAANLGLSALAARQVTLSIVDAGVGTSGTWTARLQRLDELVARICRDGGITCRVTRTFAGALKVVLGNARDRSVNVVLSDQGDLTNMQRRTVPRSRTYVVVGGQGELTDRTFRTAQHSATGEDRLEVFSDSSSLASATEVQQAADTTLALGAASWSVNAEISTSAAQQLVYGDDYEVGDTIAVELNNVRYAVPVQAVRFEISADRQQIIPVLGTAAPNLLAGLIRDVGGLRSRLDNQIA